MTVLRKGRMAIVGTSAVGLGDIRSTPTESNMAGVEVHVQLIEAALSGNFLDGRLTPLFDLRSTLLDFAPLLLRVLLLIGALRFQFAGDPSSLSHGSRTSIFEQLQLLFERLTRSLGQLSLLLGMPNRLLVDLDLCVLLLL